MADLEHAVMADALTSYKQVGAKPLNSWLTQKWFLTALPQRFTPFRQSSPNIQLFAVPKIISLYFVRRMILVRILIVMVFMIFITLN
ncbi:hypothetical protein AB3538_00390 [Acinetobacter baumannii]